MYHKTFANCIRHLFRYYQNPLFPQDEFEKVKTQKLSEVKLEKARPATLLQALARKVSYGQDHPSARYKTEATYKAINLEAIKEFYSLYFRPNNATMAVVGDVKPAEIKSMLEKYYQIGNPVM